MIGTAAASRSAGPDGAAPKRAWGKFAIRVLGSAVILAVLFYMLPWHELRAAFGRVSLSAFLSAIAIYMSLHLIGAAKWRMVVNAAGAGISFLHAVRFYWAGLFGNTFLPSVVGGDVVRAGLALKYARSKTGLLLGSVLDRLIDILGLAGVAGIGVLLLPTALDERSRRIFIALFLTLGVLGVLGAAGVYLFTRRRLSMRVRRRLVGLRKAVRSMARRPGVVLASLLAGMVLQGSLVFLTAWLGRLCGIDAPIQVWLFVWPLAKISALLPITQGGLGVREAAQAALFAPFGVPAVLAVAVSLVFQGVIFSGGLLGGLLSFVLGRFQPVQTAPDTLPLREGLALREP